MSITLRIEGLERLQAGVNAGPATLAREVRAAMEASGKLVEATQRDLAPRFSGETINSIATTIAGGGASIVASIGPRSPHAIYADRGRGPGRPPPVAAIEAWARAKGMNPYALAKSIGRKGTKGKPFVAPSLGPNIGRIKALFSEAGFRTVVRMAG